MIELAALRTILAGFATGVLLVFLILGWKVTRPINRVVIIAFATVVAISTVTRLLVFEPGMDPSPMWLPGSMDYGYMTISVLLIVSIWSSIIRKHSAERIKGEQL